jgi:hypothetical protein
MTKESGTFNQRPETSGQNQPEAQPKQKNKSQRKDFWCRKDPILKDPLILYGGKGFGDHTRLL